MHSTAHTSSPPSRVGTAAAATAFNFKFPRLPRPRAQAEPKPNLRLRGQREYTGHSASSIDSQSSQVVLYRADAIVEHGPALLTTAARAQHAPVMARSQAFGIFREAGSLPAPKRVRATTLHGSPGFQYQDSTQSMGGPTDARNRGCVRMVWRLVLSETAPRGGSLTVCMT